MDWYAIKCWYAIKSNQPTLLFTKHSLIYIKPKVRAGLVRVEFINNGLLVFLSLSQDAGSHLNV